MSEKEMDLETMIGQMVGAEKEESTSDYIAENIVEIAKFDKMKIGFKSDLFQEGVDSVSVLCGAITALVNIGITPTKAMDYLIDKEASADMIQHAENISKIQADAMVQGAKAEIARAKMETI